MPNWHIEAMTHALERVLRGQTKRLLITVPPRSLKSICASVALPAFALGQDPTQRIICVSYSEALGEEARQRLPRGDARTVLHPHFSRDANQRLKRHRVRGDDHQERVPICNLRRGHFNGPGWKPSHSRRSDEAAGRSLSQRSRERAAVVLEYTSPPP